MRPSPFVLCALAAAAPPGLAHVPPLQLPAASPKAAVGRRVGLTDVAVTLAREKLRLSFPIDVGTKTALLGEKGDAKAAANHERALSMTEDEEQTKRIRGEIAKLRT